MTIEIIPAGASAVVTEHHRDHKDGSRHPDRWDLSAQAERIAIGAADRQERFNTERVNQAERFKSALTDQASTYGTADALASAHSDEENQENFMLAQKQLSDAATATVVGFKDAQAIAYQVEGRGLLEAAKNAAALSIQMQKDVDGLSNQATANFNALNVQSNLMQYTLLLDSTKNAAAATLLSTQQAASAAAAMAECCCELKAKISYEGEKTRDLISANETQDLRDRAARSEAALAAYFARNVSPVVPSV
jgi:hypothetical protein